MGRQENMERKDPKSRHAIPLYTTILSKLCRIGAAAGNLGPLAVVQRHAGEMDPVTVASASRRSQDWGLRTLLVLDDSEVSDTIIVFMVYEGAFDRA